jgi:Domain of unknown function (DUF1906)
MRSISCHVSPPGTGPYRLGRGPARGRAAIWAGMVIAGMLLPAVPAAAAAVNTAHPGLRRVTYLGHSFEVPRTWQVIHLSPRRHTCVRFDRHVVYLGTPPRNQACPSSLVGTTEAMLISPVLRDPPAASLEDKVTRRMTVITRRLDITATFDAHPAEIDRILASAHLPRPVPGVMDPPQARLLPAGVTNFHGRGFDTCTAPSEAVMAAWLRSSPYQAIGIYLGGSDAACAQPNLTPAWLRAEAAAGWHFIPMYVGPQELFGELTKKSARQGAAAAADAAQHARQLGFRHGTPIYYDMEGYLPGHSGRVLRFLSAWTTTLHALGYDSGVYSSSTSGVADLDQQYGLGTYAMPDVIFDALWNGHANTEDPVFGRGKWIHHHRVHQYNGDLNRTYGGSRLNIDQDFMNVRLSDPPDPPSAQAVSRSAGTASPQAVTQPGGAIDVFFRGTGGGLWYLRHLPGGGWARPVDLGGQLASEPSAVASGGGHLVVFYRGTDGLLWQVRSGPAGWSRPRALRRMGKIGGRPMAVAQSTGVIDVFWRGLPGGHLSYAEYRPQHGWDAPQRLRGELASDPSPVVSSRGVTQVFWQGTNGRLWRIARSQRGRWGGPEKLGAQRLGSAPQAIARPGGKVEVFWRRPDRTAIVAGLLTASGHWRGPYPLGGGTSLSPPVPVSVGGLVHVLFGGRGGRLWQLVPASSGRPGGPGQLAARRLLSVPFAAVAAGGSRIDVFWTGSGGRLWSLRISRGGRASVPHQLSGPMP